MEECESGDSLAKKASRLLLNEHDDMLGSAMQLQLEKRHILIGVGEGGFFFVFFILENRGEWGLERSGLDMFSV